MARGYVAHATTVRHGRIILCRQVDRLTSTHDVHQESVESFAACIVVLLNLINRRDVQCISLRMINLTLASLLIAKITV